MLADIPTTFRCDICTLRHDRERLCWTVLRADRCACVACCGCADHALADADPGGTVVWPWSGLCPS